jgi:hypothetical protein
MDSTEQTVMRATKNLAVRAALTTAFMSGYSILVLGNSPSVDVFKNGAAVGVSAAAAEAAFRYGIENLHILKARGANSILYMGGESALTSAIYSRGVFPRLYPGADVPQSELMMVSFGADLAAQLTQPMVSKLLDPDQSLYDS